MIFLTVGHQTPFDRLVMAMDKWAASNQHACVRGQIGEGSYLPRHFEFQRWLDADEFNDALLEADCIVAHAGTGTIIEALERHKPVLVVPRLAALGETRNDHQIGTARYFSEAGLVRTVVDGDDLAKGMCGLQDWQPHGQFSSTASDSLLRRLEQFVLAAERSS